MQTQHRKLFFLEQLHYCNQVWQALQAPLIDLGAGSLDDALGQGAAADGMSPITNFHELFSFMSGFLWWLFCLDLSGFLFYVVLVGNGN